jgi:hypothetical protein
VIRLICAARKPFTICVLIAGIAVHANQGRAESAGEDGGTLAWSAGADLWSAYWYRGMLATDRITFQPSLNLSYEKAGLDLTVWSSTAVQDRDRLGSADEIDLILNYAKPFSWAGRSGAVNIGYTEYFFTAYSGSASHTEEVMLGAGLDGRLAPSLTAYFDVGLYDETYVEASIEPEISLRPEDRLTLVLTAVLGAGEYGEPFGLRDAQTGCALRFRTGALTMAPGVKYAYVPAGPEEGESRFLGGLSVGFGQ